MNQWTRYMFFKDILLWIPTSRCCEILDFHKSRMDGWAQFSLLSSEHFWGQNNLRYSKESFKTIKCSVYPTNDTDNIGFNIQCSLHWFQMKCSVLSNGSKTSFKSRKRVTHPTITSAEKQGKTCLSGNVFLCISDFLMWGNWLKHLLSDHEWLSSVNSQSEAGEVYDRAFLPSN